MTRNERRPSFDLAAAKKKAKRRDKAQRKSARHYARSLVGFELELRYCAHLVKLGWRAIVAKPSRVWIGPTGLCARCGKSHPLCGSVCRTVSHDFFGLVDVLGVGAEGWLVVSCGPHSQAAEKRRSLASIEWPLWATAAQVVTPDGRSKARENTVRIWQAVRWGEKTEWHELKPVAI